MQVGLQARLMSQGLRKLTGNASRSAAITRYGAPSSACMGLPLAVAAPVATR
jgi:hypothetical protein